MTSEFIGMEWYNIKERIVDYKGNVLLKKTKTRPQMDIGRRGLLPGNKKLLKGRWGDLWGLTGKDKKLRPREVKTAIK